MSNTTANNQSASATTDANAPVAARAEAGKHGLGAPVFLCGHAKSGTTLLAALLDHHSQIAVFPEESFYTKHIVNGKPMDARAGAQHLLENFRPKIEGMDDEAIFDRWNFPYFKDFSDFKQRFESALQARSAENGTANHGHVIESYVDAFAQASGQTGKRYWVEKTHGNELALKMLEGYFPDLRAIYIVRDPRDIYGSWARRMKASSKSESLDNFLCRWGVSVWTWRQFTARNPNSMTVRYEDLLRYPQQTLAMICAFLDIPYEEVLEKPTKDGHLWEGNSMHSDKFQGISTAPIGRWHDSLNASQVEMIEGCLGGAMQSLGYQLSLPPKSFRQVTSLIKGSPRKSALFGMMMRLYWPFSLPKRLRLRDVQKLA